MPEKKGTGPDPGDNDNRFVIRDADADPRLTPSMLQKSKPKPDYAARIIFTVLGLLVIGFVVCGLQVFGVINIPNPFADTTSAVKKYNPWPKRQSTTNTVPATKPGATLTYEQMGSTINVAPPDATTLAQQIKDCEYFFWVDHGYVIARPGFIGDGCPKDIQYPPTQAEEGYEKTFALKSGGKLVVSFKDADKTTPLTQIVPVVLVK